MIKKFGMEIAQSSKGTSKSQLSYTIDLRAETGFNDKTPIDNNNNISKDKAEPCLDAGTHKRLVGKSIYLSCTHSDI